MAAGSQRSRGVQPGGGQLQEVLVVGCHAGAIAWLLYMAGALDAEVGARFRHIGFSIYVTPPLLVGYRSLYFVAALVVVFSLVWRRLGGLGMGAWKSRRVVAGMVMCLCVVSIVGSTVGLWDSGPAKALLTPKAFFASRRCEEEPTIGRSMRYLSESNATVSTAAITAFWEFWKNKHPDLVDHIFRVQIVGGRVFYSYAPMAATSSRKPMPRLRMLLDDVAWLSRRVRLRDLDFLVWLGDGWEANTLPAGGGGEAGPVFVREMMRGTRNIMVPPRSMSGCPGWDAAATSGSGAPWEYKIPRAVWRGSMTGGMFEEGTWRDFPRSRAAFLSREQPSILDAAFKAPLSGQATDGARREVAREGLVRPGMSHEEQQEYRVVLNIDGNSLADRLPEQMARGSVIVKQDSPHEEYWYEEMRPFEHYIPVSRDLSDLSSVINATLAADRRGVAEAGALLVLRRLGHDSCRCYWAKLLDAYASFVPPGGVQLLSGAREWPPYQ